MLDPLLYLYDLRKPISRTLREPRRNGSIHSLLQNTLEAYSWVLAITGNEAVTEVHHVFGGASFWPDGLVGRESAEWVFWCCLRAWKSGVRRVGFSLFFFHFFPSSSRSSSSTFSVQKNSPFFLLGLFFLSRFKLSRWKINGILTFLFIFLPFLLLIPPFLLLGEMVDFTVFRLCFFTVFPLRLRGLTSEGMYSFERNLNYLTLFRVFLLSFHPHEVQLITHCTVMISQLPSDELSLLSLIHHHSQ